MRRVRLQDIGPCDRRKVVGAGNTVFVLDDYHTVQQFSLDTGEKLQHVDVKGFEMLPVQLAGQDCLSFVTG